MVKRLLTFVLLLTGSISMLAQNRTITGSLYDAELKENAYETEYYYIKTIQE